MEVQTATFDGIEDVGDRLTGFAADESCLNVVNHFAQALRVKRPLSGHFQPPPRTKKASPCAEFGNPTDLVDKFAFLGLAMLLVPQNAIFRNPMRVRSLRK